MKNRKIQKQRLINYKDKKWLRSMSTKTNKQIKKKRKQKEGEKVFTSSNKSSSNL